MLRALSGESLPITRYSAPYCERKSRSIARNTSESSSTLSNTGFGIIALVYGYNVINEGDCSFPGARTQTEPQPIEMVFLSLDSKFCVWLRKSVPRKFEHPTSATAKAGFESM